MVQVFKIVQPVKTIQPISIKQLKSNWLNGETRKMV